MKLTFKINLN